MTRARATVSAVLAAAAFTLLYTATSGPVAAEVQSVSDPAGDGMAGDDLDITAIRFKNGDRRITVKVSVVHVAAGDFAVRMQARGVRHERRAMIYSSFDGQGEPTESFATPKHSGCAGLRVEWDESNSRLTASFPISCWRHGNVGAVRGHVITEYHAGRDADLAPKNPDGSWGWTPWTARG